MESTNVEKMKSGYPEVAAIGEDLSCLTKDVKKLVKHVKDDGLHDLSEKAREGAEQLQDLSGKMEERIVKNPAQSVAIAFAGGFLISLLLNGRR